MILCHDSLILFPYFLAELMIEYRTLYILDKCLTLSYISGSFLTFLILRYGFYKLLTQP